MRRFLALTLLWLVALLAMFESAAVIVAHRFGIDSHAYWMAWQGPMYGILPGESDAYLYSPAFAQVLWPFAQLPWPAFATVFAAGLVVALVWLLRPVPLRWALPLGVIGLNEVFVGNIYLLLAVVAAVGFRHPAAWAFAGLSKITPFVGPIWFLVRREWRPLVISLSATVAIAAVSYAIDPGAWHDWARFLVTNASMAQGQTGGSILPPLVVRLPVALAIVVWGALTGKRWTVPVAMVIGTPVIGSRSFFVLFALPRILAHREEHRDASTGTAAAVEGEAPESADQAAG